VKSDFVVKDPRGHAQARLGPSATTEERLAFLNDASTRIGTTLDLTQTCRETMDVVLPRFADAGGIMVQERLVVEGEFPERPADGSAEVRRVSAGAASGDPADWQAAFTCGEVVVYSPLLPQAQAMTTGKTVHDPRLDPATAAGIGRVFGREVVGRVLTGASFLVVPLLARGNVLGFLVLTRDGHSAPFADADLALAEELAARTAICIDNARLYGRERRTALTLQSSLLPTFLHRPPGLEIASRYLPASDLTSVGGDWFDVIALTGSRTALVVGDVMGHGIRAAATMGQLRTATRTLASLDLAPGELLFRLDRVAQQLDPDQIATCVYATYDPASRVCAIATAGHVPPVLLRPCGSTEVVEAPPGTPLGIGQARPRTQAITLPEHSVLAFYTDGLVESRERDIDEGIATLRTLLTGPARSLENLCDVITGSRHPSRERDDIALLLARTL
jgi:serine phosphatase RsbU (regulator of sigma subunit)